VFWQLKVEIIMMIVCEIVRLTIGSDEKSSLVLNIDPTNSIADNPYRRSRIWFSQAELGSSFG
jgi:hypothetical protein